MSESPWIHVGTEQSFAARVLLRSQEVPVLVDFWAAWCAPCRTLMPVLAQLADEYRGQFDLVKVDTDQERALAAQYAVRSLPTVKVFKAGAVVDEIVGALPAAALRGVIDRHLVRVAERLRQQAHAALAHGQTVAAAATLREAIATEPEYLDAHLDLVRALLAAGDTAAAEEALAAVPRRVEAEQALAALAVQLELTQAAAAAAPLAALQRAVTHGAASLEQHYQLGARLFLAQDYDGALAQMLAVMQADRSFGNDIGRRALLALFERLGPGDPRVARYRGRMFALMH